MEWLPVLTFALGQLVIVVLAYIQNRWAKDREEQAQEATREEVRREFQRKSLLELQAAIHDLGRAWSRMYHEDDMAFRTTGKWGGNLYSEDWSDRESDARIRVRIHSSRVIDKSARETLKCS